MKLDKLINKYAVLILETKKFLMNNKLNLELFGQIEESGVKSNITKPDERRLSTKIADVSNIDKNSKIFKQNDPRRIFNLGNRLWHSDSSFKLIPAKYSILSGRTVSKKGVIQNLQI